MNGTLKTALVIGGTVVATGVVCNILTDGAVVDSLQDKWAALTSGSKDDEAAAAKD